MVWNLNTVCDRLGMHPTSGDYGSPRGYFMGTHRGEFNGIPATGKPVENWVQMDMLGLMQQLGVAPGERCG